MIVLLDGTYPEGLAEELRRDGIEAYTAVERGLGGRADADVLAAAAADGLVLLTENIADFARIAAQRLIAGEHHPGVLIALSSRFSRCRAGFPKLAAAVRAVATEDLADRVVYLPAAPE